MKKLYTLMAALLATAAVSAESVTWNIDEALTGYKSGTELNEMTFQINSNIEVSFLNDAGTNSVVYRKSSADKVGFIVIYKDNTMTVTAKDATITGLNFSIDDNADDPQTGSNTTASWSVRIDDTLYGPSRPAGESWEGSTSELTVTGNSKTTILALTIEYTVDGDDNGGDDNGGDDNGDEGDDNKEYENAEFLFENYMGQNAQYLTMESNGTTLAFTGSANASLNQATNTQGAPSYYYFGDAENYVSLSYRYQPGGTSTNGINSNVKGVCTFPTDGEFYIYAYNNQTDPNNPEAGRSLVVNQNDEDIFTYEYKATGYVEAQDNANRKVWPIKSVEVKKGTAYLLWPNGQVQFYAFVFVPEGNEFTSSIDPIFDDAINADEKAYDLLGRPVGDNYKGLVIKGGKKYILK